MRRDMSSVHEGHGDDVDISGAVGVLVVCVSVCWGMSGGVSVLCGVSVFAEVRMSGGVIVLWCVSVSAGVYQGVSVSCGVCQCLLGYDGGCQCVGGVCQCFLGHVSGCQCLVGCVSRCLIMRACVTSSGG